MKKILSDLLKLSLIIIPPKIANAFYSRIFSPSIISFMFHAVSNETVPHIKYLFPILDEKRFENSILYLKNKYEFIDYEKLIRINKKGKVTKTRVFLSFDDGYSECFDVVRPILVKHKIPCTFFITTDWIDNKNIFYGNKISICLSTLKEKRKDQISVLLWWCSIVSVNSKVIGQVS